jgi:hypothetical protein
MRKLGVLIYCLVLLPASAWAASPLKQGVDTAVPTDRSDPNNIKAVGPSGLLGAGGAFNTIANILIFLVGALAVIVLVFGGFRYVTSTGDPGRVKQAKDTIIYGVVGVVIALLAYAIVNFVISNIK